MIKGSELTVREGGGDTEAVHQAKPLPCPVAHTPFPPQSSQLGFVGIVGIGASYLLLTRFLLLLLKAAYHRTSLDTRVHTRVRTHTS